MSNSLNVLLVEDHAADARLVEEALEHCHIAVNLNSVKDGEEAINYIKQAGCYTNVQRPDLIILDLNMPRKDGHEFLDEMHTFLKDKEIPVVLLTVSENPQDISRAMNRHMNYFLSKPVDATKLQRVLNAINELWNSGKSCGH